MFSSTSPLTQLYLFQEKSLTSADNQNKLELQSDASLVDQ